MMMASGIPAYLSAYERLHLVMFQCGSGCYIIHHCGQFVLRQPRTSNFEGPMMIMMIEQCSHSRRGRGHRFGATSALPAPGARMRRQSLLAASAAMCGHV
jgi:hypothetical protein